MAQQINLLTPILLAPRRYFSALAMVQALGLVLLGGIAISVWMHLQAQQARREIAAAQEQTRVERQRLLEALTALPAPADPRTLEQQWNTLVQQNERQQQLLRAIQGGLGRAGERHSDLLRLVAASVPASVWIDELQWIAGPTGRLELTGATLDPAALRQWLARLAAQPLLQVHNLDAVRVEKVAGSIIDASVQRSGETTLPPLVGRQTAERAGLPIWAFRVVSAPPGVAMAASAGAPMAAANASGVAR